MTTAERCFIVTAHTLHMGKAAELLFSSQQAVSDNIRRLERTRSNLVLPQAEASADAGRSYFVECPRTY